MRKILIAASIAVLSSNTGDALAQGKGKGNGNPPTWQGASPPGFSSPGNRTGWGGNTQPPGWGKAQTSPGWNGGNAPPGLIKKGNK